MAEYFFENRKDRTLKAYLRIGESIESSFLLTFKLTDPEPRSVIKGSDKTNEALIEKLEQIARMQYIQIAKDQTIGWIPIPVTDDRSQADDKSFVYDAAITLLVKNYIQSLNLN